jgi:osmotically-inducible protein OsmY
MRNLFFVAAAAAILLVGCTKKEEGTAPAVGDAAKGAVTAAVDAAQDLEVGCAMCVYKVAGVTACAPAVKVGDKVMMLTGYTPKEHELCAAAKKASVTGKVEGDKFVATKVELK